MSSDNFNIKVKKAIIYFIESALAIAYFVAVLLSSTLNDGFSFRYIPNQSTGEPTGFLCCIFLYILLWFIASMLFSAALIVTTEIPCAIITKGDFKSQKNEGIFAVLGYFGLLLGYSLMAILFFLHVSGIATIDFLIF